MTINIYIENTDYNAEPNVVTEKGKLDVIKRMAQNFRETDDWVDNILYEHYHHNELYQKMLTDKGREEVEYFLQCAAKDSAEEQFEEEYFATTLEV